jgi:NAD(P)-dependent dehydrogenase (short-subunit alcohol dehydrogenase family)
VIATNLTGVFLCMKYELLEMKKAKRGCIINNSSVLGKVGFMGSAGYVAASHGVIGITQTAALEFAPFGIRVNAVCPPSPKRRCSAGPASTTTTSCTTP